MEKERDIPGNKQEVSSEVPRSSGDPLPKPAISFWYLSLQDCGLSVPTSVREVKSLRGLLGGGGRHRVQG